MFNKSIILPVPHQKVLFQCAMVADCIHGAYPADPNIWRWIAHDVCVSRDKNDGLFFMFLRKKWPCGGIPLMFCIILFQWEVQDPKLEVLYHIRPYMVGTSNLGSWNGHWLLVMSRFDVLSHHIIYSPSSYRHALQYHNISYPLVNFHITNWKITMFNG